MGEKHLIKINCTDEGTLLLTPLQKSIIINNTVSKNINKFKFLINPCKLTIDMLCTWSLNPEVELSTLYDKNLPLHSIVFNNK